MMTPPPDRFSAVDDPEEFALFVRPVSGADGRCEVTVAIDGIHCSACSVAIESALAGLTERVDVSVAARRAHLVWQPARVPLSALLRVISGLRYSPRPIPLDALTRIDVRARRAALWRVLLAALCMMQVMMVAVPRYLAADAMTPDLRSLLIWAELMLSAPVLLFAAGPFFSGAWKDAMQQRVGMDTPVALGILVAFVTSLFSLERDEAVYFDSVTMFIALLLAARWLESIARERAAAGLASSLAALPQTAARIDAGGEVERVSCRRLRAGDRVMVPAGETIPADGVIATGETTVDEALLTGESRELARGIGGKVVAGSLNLSQPIEITVTHGVAQSRLAELHQLVERAALARPALLRAADRVAGPFLPAIIAIAAMTGIGWLFIDPERAPWIAASVLIVTCPCALALAAPCALLAALGSLARRGIVVDCSDTLEALAGVDVAVFDKTGTLTTGTPVITVAALDGLTALDALRIAAAIERSSLHPVASAFLRARDLADANAVPVEVSGAMAIPGGGLAASVRIDGEWSAARVRPQGERIRLEVDSTDPAARLRSADFDLHESLREDAAAVLSFLRDEGVACRIASGDHPSRVISVAERLDIDAAAVLAGATPETKLALVTDFQQHGATVMMVGDGVNDAPVLGHADVSVSFASAAPLARHQAGVLLLNDRLDSLRVARTTARRAMRIVRQNLGFAIVYNLVAIPLAIVGQLPPWLAGLGMAGSSLIVVVNALRAGR